MSSIAKIIKAYTHGLEPPVALRAGVTGSKQVEFPARYFTTDPHEEDISARHAYVKALAKRHASKVDVYYDPELINEQIMLMLNQQSENIQYSFHEFVSKFYKPNVSQANARAMNEVLPEYRDMRMKTIEMKWELLEMIASWSIKSMLSREDILFLFALVHLDKDQRDEFINWLTTDSLPYPKGKTKWTQKEQTLKKIIDNTLARYKQNPILGAHANIEPIELISKNPAQKRVFSKGSAYLGPGALRVGANDINI